MASGLHVCLFIFAVIIGCVPCTKAHKEITCLTFDKDFFGQYGIWTQVNGQVTRVRSGTSAKCAFFNGHGGHISIPRFKSSYGAWNQFSISMWYKRSSDHRMVVLNTEECWDTAPLTIMFYPGDRIRFSLGLTNGDASLGGTGNAQDWNHLVMSWTGKEAILYLNGNVVGSHNFPGNGGRMRNSRCDLILGTPPSQADPVFQPFDGYLDQVCFYRVGLSPREVTFLFNNPSTTRLP